MTTGNGKTNFRQLDKSVRIQKIIDTAAEIFHKKGYRATTLDDVSKELGITKAAIYHYVSSKEQILSRIYIEALENIFKNTYEIAGKDLPPDARLKLIIRNHVKSIIIDSISMFSVFFTEENQLPTQEVAKIKKEKNKYNKIVEDIIKEGISQGIFKNVDAKLQAFAITGMCNWVYKWYKPGDSYFTPDQIADHFVSLLETGYLTRDTQIVENTVGSESVVKKPPLGETHQLNELRSQCMHLIELINELEMG